MLHSNTAGSACRPARFMPRPVRLALTVAVAAAPALSIAQMGSAGQERLFSLGLAGTATHWRASCLALGLCDRNDSGWRLTGSWHLSPQASLEVVATDQGRVHAQAFGVAGLRSTELRVRGLGLGAAWTVPVRTDWLLALRAGILSNRAQWTERDSALEAESAQRRTDPTAGLGLSWRVSPQWSIDGRLDWTRTRLTPPAESLLGGGSTNAHQWGLGLTASF